MDVRAISPDGDLHKKVYTWHNQMVLLWKEKILWYHLMISDHRIVVSKVLWEQRKVWF